MCFVLMVEFEIRCFCVYACVYTTIDVSFYSTDFNSTKLIFLRQSFLFFFIFGIHFFCVFKIILSTHGLDNNAAKRA